MVTVESIMIDAFGVFLVACGPCVLAPAEHVANTTNPSSRSTSKEFSPHLNANVLMGGYGIDGLINPHIHVPIRGAAEGPFSDIPERSYGGQGEQRGVEPRHADVPGRAGAPGSATGRRHAAVLACG